MKIRIVTLAVAAVAALGVPAAQAHMLSGNGAYKAAKLTKTQQAWIKSIRMLGRSLPSYAR
jgi:hypothetical protein